jgi:hypothetical protein
MPPRTRPQQHSATGQDEADIVAELGAEPVDPDEPNGPLLADEAKVREAGAVDAESIRANRIAQDTVGRKRAGQKNVTINEPLLTKYETVTQMWPVNTLTILVKRLTGTQIDWTINSQPKNAAELYAAIKQLHGRHEEATYEVSFRDSQQKQNRGTGRITLPDTRDELPPQPPPGFAPPQGFSPQGAPMMPAPYYPQQQPMQPQPAQPFVPGMPPAGMDVNAMLAWQKQQFELWQAAQRGGAPAPVPMPAPVQAAPAPVATPGMDFAAMMALQKQQFEMWQVAQGHAAAPAPAPAAAAPGMDFAAMMALQKQQFEMWQAAQAQAAAAAPAAPPAAQALPGMDFATMMALQKQQFEMWQAAQAQAARPAAPAPAPAAPPQTMGMPPVQAPPGMFFVPGFGYVPADRLFQALSGTPLPQGPYRGPMADGPYRGPRPYGRGDYPGAPSYGGGPGYPPEPPRPKTAAEEFSDARKVIQGAIALADELRPPSQPTQAAPEPEEDDSPVRVIDAGPAKLVINRADGSARYWETGWANMDKVLKWVGEQREAIQQAQTARESAKQQHLPPGYVEVGPGYQPPPGFIAVPVDRIPAAAVHAPAPLPAAQPLPQPPAEMPPPIAAAEPQRRTWGMPEMPPR